MGESCQREVMGRTVIEKDVPLYQRVINSWLWSALMIFHCEAVRYARWFSVRAGLPPAAP